MKKILFRRLLMLIPILFGVTFLSFAMMRIAGSDAVLQKNGYFRCSVVRGSYRGAKRRDGTG